MSEIIFTKISKEEEIRLAEELKQIMDKDANFVRPLSDFWKGSSREQTFSFGHYGLWLSGEGGSMIGGEYIADYYDISLVNGLPQLQAFMTKNNLKLRWHDCGTPMLIHIKDEF